MAEEMHCSHINNLYFAYLLFLSGILFRFEQIPTKRKNVSSSYWKMHHLKKLSKSTYAYSKEMIFDGIR